MKPFPAIALIFLAALFSFSAIAEDEASWEVEALSQILPGTVEGGVEYDFASGTAIGTNGIYVNYNQGSAVLTADSASVNRKTGEVEADGNVRIESGDQLWVGEHIRYNFKTRQMRSEQFRTGKAPVFAGGTQLTGDGSNRIYTAQSAFVTTDDYAEPAYRVRAVAGGAASRSFPANPSRCGTRCFSPRACRCFIFRITSATLGCTRIISPSSQVTTAVTARMR